MQQVIIYANVDPDLGSVTVSLGYNELTFQPGARPTKHISWKFRTL